MSKNILVADDSLTIQKIISVSLSKSNHNLSECHTLEELRERVNENSYDLILLDMSFSDELSSFDLVSEIREVLPEVHWYVWYIRYN